MAAVENPNLTDQSVIAYIAKNAGDPSYVRGVAIAKLTDRSLLADLAKSAHASDVRDAAIKNPNLTDQSLLANVAKKYVRSDLRKAAVENPNLTDQSVLADVAKNDREWYIRAAAYRKLGDEQSSLALSAKNDSDWRVRMAAVEKLTEPEALKTVAEKYLLDIRRIYQCDEQGWQKAESLILIAKRYPQIFKENRKQVNNSINNLHRDNPSSDCHDDAMRVNVTAASKGLHFPPYPFND
jgi:hypothetical protein